MQVKKAPERSAPPSATNMRGFVVHEDRDVVAATNAGLAQEMGHLVGPRLVGGKGHHLAARCHDDGRLLGMECGVSSGVHGVGALLIAFPGTDRGRRRRTAPMSGMP